MRLTASASGSSATAMWKPLACSSRPRLRDDADVPFPVDQIARTQFAETAAYVDLRAEARLHVAVAWTSIACGLESDLHEARAIESEIGAAAPEIGRADESACRADEIGNYGINWNEMRRRNEPAVVADGKIGFLPDHERRD